MQIRSNEGTIRNDGTDSAAEADELAQVRKAVRDAQRGEVNDLLFESEFKERFGITFEADPPDSLVFEYGGDGRVIVRTFQQQGAEADAVAAAAGDNPFTIFDATDGGTELILVSPGLLEVINGAFSTFIVPTLGGDPITDQTPIGAVTGVVYLEVTVNAGSGIPTAAAVKNSVSLPADTATLKHIQIGTITVGADVVTVDSQDVTADIRYTAHARDALHLYFETIDGELKVRISYGTIDGVVPPQVQGGSGPTDYAPTAAKYWAKSEYDEDGQTGVVSIGSGSSVPLNSETATHYLIGEVQIISDVPTIFQATQASLVSFRCGAKTYSWGGA